jgi:hypothetical protein
MGFDSIYQDWKEKGLFVKRLRIQHRKINPTGKPLPQMAGYGYNSSSTRIGNYVGRMLGLFAHRLDGLSIRKDCRARIPSYSHRDKSHLRIMEIDVRATWMVVSVRNTLEWT